MKVKYDPEADAVSIRFSDAKVDESDEQKPGVILDYDKKGNVVAIEILNASKHMKDPRTVEHTVTETKSKKAVGG